MKKYLFLLLLSLVSLHLLGQKPSFTLTVDPDTVLINNTVLIKYTLKQTRLEGGFDTPDFEHFSVVSGPNISTSTTYINGDMTSTSTYSFYLTPDSPGTWIIPSVTIQTKEGTMIAREKELVVLPNPEGIKRTPKMQREDFPFLNEAPGNVPKKKKKRKTYRL